MSFPGDALISRSAWRREVASLLLGILLRFAAWLLTCLFLSEGIPREKGGAGIAAGLMNESRVWALTGQILLNSGAVSFVLTPLAAHLVIGRLPLAYFVGFGDAILFGLYLGSSSLTDHPPSPPPPSLSIFRGTGAWELAAYLTVGAALARIDSLRQERLLSWRVERATRPGSLGRAEWVLLAVGATVVVATAWTEAVKVVGRS